jgi:hypothetical protein
MTPELVLKFENLKQWRNKLWIMALITSPITGIVYYFYTTQNRLPIAKTFIESVGCSLAVLELFWSYYQGQFKEKKLPEILALIFKEFTFIPRKDKKFAINLKIPFPPERCRDFCHVLEKDFEIIFYQVKRPALRYKDFSGQVFQINLNNENHFDIEKLKKVLSFDNWTIQIRQIENSILIELPAKKGFLTPHLWGEVLDPQEIYFIHKLMGDLAR